ncbi:MAG TPA: replication-relaxation family protein [Rhizomicrobium sp.]
MGAVRASKPRFRREGDAPRVELTEDDVAILRCIYQHRFVRADDLYRLFPQRSKDRLSRRLMTLYRAGFLDRPASQIDRFRQGGSQALVYGLDNAGARFLKEKLGSPIGATDWRSRNRTYTRDNLGHTLAVSTFLINLELECRARGDVSLIPFENMLERAPEKTRNSPMPGKWPVQVQVNGSRAQVYIAPDAIFALQFKKDGQTVRSHFFLEIDRGTMTIAPAESVRRSEAFLYRATLLRKFLAYVESWRQKRHQEHLGIGNARTLFLTTTAVRSSAVQKAARILLDQANVSASLFLFGTDQMPSLSKSYLDARGMASYLAMRANLSV